MCYILKGADKMKCMSCGIEVPSTFRFAIEKNECPSCGKSIMGEEALVLLGQLEETIKINATVRDETAKKLALVLLSEYEIQSNKQPKVEQPKVEQPKVKANPAPAQKQEVIITEEEDEITDEERDRMMEEAIKERYQTMDPDQEADMERLKRLAKQQNKFTSGKGVIRRVS